MHHVRIRVRLIAAIALAWHVVTDAGFMALFGTIGVLPPPSHMPVPRDAGDASSRVTVSTSSLAPIPLAPPPRA